jgi:hypothetical protein
MGGDRTSVARPFMTHLSLPALARGSPPSPPASRAERAVQEVQRRHAESRDAGRRKADAFARLTAFRADAREV